MDLGVGGSSRSSAVVGGSIKILVAPEVVPGSALTESSGGMIS